MDLQITGKICVNLFKRLGIVPDTNDFLHPSNLVGVKIPRDNLLKEGQMEQITDLIQELRGFYSASGMSCLRSTRKQKAPVINTLRQVCKANGLIMKPYSKSSGYEITGKKKLYRWFEIHAMDESLEEIRCQHERLEDQREKKTGEDQKPENVKLLHN
jgi:hypothetical protein